MTISGVALGESVLVSQKNGMWIGRIGMSDKPREWWINIFSNVVWYKEPSLLMKMDNEIVHVIEYSEYAKLQAEIDKLKTKQLFEAVIAADEKVREENVKLQEMVKSARAKCAKYEEALRAIKNQSTPGAMFNSHLHKIATEALKEADYGI